MVTPASYTAASACLNLPATQVNKQSARDLESSGNDSIISPLQTMRYVKGEETSYPIHLEDRGAETFDSVTNVVL